MQLKEKRTGKLIKTKGCVVNGPGFTMSLEAFAEQYEIVPGVEKPFKEVARPKYTLAYNIGEHDDCHQSIVVYDDGEERELHIADRDYYEILPDGAKKTKFTWDEAMEIPKKTNDKWRLPTEQEWFAICAAFGDEDGKITGKALAENLNLTTDEDGGYGYFWSSTANSTNAYNLSINVASVTPQNYSDKVYGFSVRCVAQ